MTTSKPFVVERSFINRIINEYLRLTHLIYTFAVAAACWLVFGSLVREYLGIRLTFPGFGIPP